MQQIVYDFTSSQTHLEKSFQLLHLLDFCLVHYLLSSDSKAMTKVSKLHTSFFKTKKELTSLLINLCLGLALLYRYYHLTWTILRLTIYYCFCSSFLFLYCYGRMQFFIHYNFFCQEYQFTYLLFEYLCQ